MKSNRPSILFRWLLGLVCCSVAVALAVGTSQGVKTIPAQSSVALVNAASYGNTVAPGSIAAAFGANLTNQPLAVATSLPLPTTLAGVTVKINGVAAPLFFASAGQVNLQVPNGVNPGTANIEVFNASSTTPVATGAVTVAEAAPGVFTLDQSGRNQTIAQNADFSFNADFDRVPGSRPEVTGSFVTIYATGAGRTSPLVPDGQPSPASPLAVPDGTTTVTVGGVPAQVLFSGLTPGFVGLWQISFVLPASLPTNLATPLRVELKGRQSSETTLAVVNRNEFGSVTGLVVNAVTGAPLAGASLALQPTGSGRSRATTTDGQGRYNFFVIAPGGYTLAATATGFVAATQGATVAGGQQFTAPPLALTPPLAEGQYRVVLVWRSELDLDAHLTGPIASARYHVWWNGETDLATPATAQFDRDDKTGAGPETVTFTVQATGSYRFSVQNYTDRDRDGAARLAQSGAVVRVYRGNQQITSLTAPGGGGTLWKVFEIVNGQLQVVNQLSDEPDPSRIRTTF
jgi:uncharacterized protein (TIGR03437 family)